MCARACVLTCMCMCACVRVCVRACVRACVRNECCDLQMWREGKAQWPLDPQAALIVARPDTGEREGDGQ